MVSIIIPHFNGKEILYNCLNSLEKTKYLNKEVILVDNGSTDGSISDIEESFPWLRLIRNQKNFGYAGGCNSGLREAKGKYVLFLNNDTIFESNWLDALVKAVERSEEIAACQPKLLAFGRRDTFDYSGAAGGLIDIYAYPFAMGRIFFSLEKDYGQYDRSQDIFWASGTAMLVRRSVLDEVGTFEEDFFAHMEEIDLCWRLHLAGYRVVSSPQSVVYHNSGSTLRPDSYRKILLNHRNNLVMLVKNYEIKTLVWVFPIRLALEFLNAIYAVLKFDLNQLKAIFVSLMYVFINFGKIAKKRSQVQKMRKFSDSHVFKKMYRGSIVVVYFLKKIHRAQDLSSSFGASHSQAH